MVELLLYLLPSLFSLGFVAIPMGTGALHILNFGTLTLLFLWFLGGEIVVSFWRSALQRKNGMDGARKIALGVPMVAILLLMAAAIVLLHPRIIALQYVLTLLYLALRFSILRVREHNLLLYTALSFLTLWLSGSISFSAANEVLNWQSLLLVGGIAAITTAGVVASSRSAFRQHRSFERILSFGILVAPIATSVLVFSYQLPPVFLALLVITPFAGSLAQRAKSETAAVRLGALLIPFLFALIECVLRKVN